MLWWCVNLSFKEIFGKWRRKAGGYELLRFFDDGYNVLQKLGGGFRWWLTVTGGTTLVQRGVFRMIFKAWTWHGKIVNCDWTSLRGSHHITVGALQTFSQRKKKELYSHWILRIVNMRAVDSYGSSSHREGYWLLPRLFEGFLPPPPPA